MNHGCPKQTPGTRRVREDRPSVCHVMDIYRDHVLNHRNCWLWQEKYKVYYCTPCMQERD